MNIYVMELIAVLPGTVPVLICRRGLRSKVMMNEVLSTFFEFWSKHQLKLLEDTVIQFLVLRIEKWTQRQNLKRWNGYKEAVMKQKEHVSKIAENFRWPCRPYRLRISKTTFYTPNRLLSSRFEYQRNQSLKDTCLMNKIFWSNIQANVRFARRLRIYDPGLKDAPIA